MNVDGSKDSEINIRGSEDYAMSAPEEEFHLKISSNEEREDEEQVTDTEDNGNNNHDTDFEESGTSDDESEDQNELN